ncbi:hypothetical protein BC833DRAFT_606488 [Globomyces pollinis-pini]|nr:hypothetical protein BC833DRAFT_606488 [Globomyces pollinis-pini]
MNSMKLLDIFKCHQINSFIQDPIHENSSFALNPIGSKFSKPLLVIRYSNKLQCAQFTESAYDKDYDPIIEWIINGNTLELVSIYRWHQGLLTVGKNIKKSDADDFVDNWILDLLERGYNDPLEAELEWFSKPKSKL